MNALAYPLDSDVGLLLVGHGTRDSLGVSELLELAAQIADRAGERSVEPRFRFLEMGFLEMAEPTISQAVDRLAARGVREFVVAPVLLFAAGHVRRDIPGAVGAACRRHSSLTWRQVPPLGCHPLIVKLSQQRFLEARGFLEGRAKCPPGASDAHTHRIVVGRGSQDSDATAEMHRFVKLLGEPFPELRTTTCFCAMAKPLFGETITRVAEAAANQAAANQEGPTYFIVQPHLLFHGQLLADIHQQVSEIRVAHPLQHWHVARHLGPEVEVQRAILDIIDSTATIGR